MLGDRDLAGVVLDEERHVDVRRRARRALRPAECAIHRLRIADTAARLTAGSDEGGSSGGFFWDGRAKTLEELLGQTDTLSVHTPLTQETELNRLPAGMAVRKGDLDTLNVLNNWIQANTKFLQARRHYWFETQDWRAAVGKLN